MQNEKVEYSACHLLSGKVLGSKSRFLAEETVSGGGGRHRITRDETTVYVVELQGSGRTWEIPRSQCVLERSAKVEAKQEGKVK